MVLTAYWYEKRSKHKIFNFCPAEFLKKAKGECAVPSLPRHLVVTGSAAKPHLVAPPRVLAMDPRVLGMLPGVFGKHPRVLGIALGW